MNKSLKATIGKNINSFLGLVDLKLTRLQPYTDYRDYIPFEETITGAEEAGLSVGDYIDAKHNKPGATQDTIDQMTALGVFEGQVERVCEIGPGSGRYLDKVLKICNPSYCEIYETAKDWEQWLVQQYKLTAHPTDGKSLSHTPSESIDLIQAHKVMPGQPSLVVSLYRWSLEKLSVWCLLNSSFNGEIRQKNEGFSFFCANNSIRRASSDCLSRSTTHYSCQSAKVNE
jgi:hypothetical protein